MGVLHGTTNSNKETTNKCGSVVGEIDLITRNERFLSDVD